jgi:type IV pilus assembly protein PilA
VFLHSSQRPHHDDTPSAARVAARLSARARGESGFTLVELLVVVLVIGILAAIAIPVFLSDTGKASDADAKELARTAETTAETIATENDGSYAEVNAIKLHEVEPTIAIVAQEGQAYLSAATGDTGEYSLTATSPNGDELTIKRNPAGEVTRECASPREKTGCSEGESGSW